MWAEIVLAILLAVFGVVFAVITFVVMWANSLAVATNARAIDYWPAFGFGIATLLAFGACGAILLS